MLAAVSLNESWMFRLLIDTSVWLDVAKDHQHQATLGVLEELVQLGEVSLILPTIVVDEFRRNKARIVQEGQRSLSTVLKRAKEVVSKLGDAKEKRLVLEHLTEVDYRLPNLGDRAMESIARIEAMFSHATIVEISDGAKLRAAERAIAKKAPFHTHRNSMADAVLMETYGDLVAAKSPGVRFAFITHNTKDFSHQNGDSRLPHPDFQAYFSRIKSLYFIRLSEALQRVKPALVSDLMLEQEWTEEPRRLAEIVEAVGELLDKVWYNRHQVRREKIEGGEIKVVEKEAYPPTDYRERTIQRDIWEGAKKSARRVEKQYGLEKLGPWDDFEWGMINGKLSALRWVLGDEWDMLDT
jgi:PIN domain